MSNLKTINLQFVKDRPVDTLTYIEELEDKLSKVTGALEKTPSNSYVDGLRKDIDRLVSYIVGTGKIVIMVEGSVLGVASDFKVVDKDATEPSDDIYELTQG